MDYLTIVIDCHGQDIDAEELEEALDAAIESFDCNVEAQAPGDHLLLRDFLRMTLDSVRTAERQLAAALGEAEEG